MVDERRHVLDTQIVRPGTGQSHVVDDVFSFFIIEIAVLQNASLPYIVFCFFRTFLFCISYKLVDCLEKCLIYGHIRRFAN